MFKLAFWSVALPLKLAIHGLHWIFWSATV